MNKENMKITVKWLKKHNACSEGIDWFNNQSETDGIKIVKKLIKEKKYSWAIKEKLYSWDYWGDEI